MIVAFDVASRTGIAYGDPGGRPTLVTKSFTSTGAGEAEYFASAIEFTQRFLTGLTGVTTVVVEGRAMVANTYTSLHHGLWACVAGMVRHLGLDLIEAPISTWRAYSLGNGRMEGKRAKARAVELCGQLGWDAQNHDAAEAAMIWLYGCALRDPKRVPRHEPLFLKDAVSSHKDPT